MKLGHKSKIGVNEDNLPLHMAKIAIIQKNPWIFNIFNLSGRSLFFKSESCKSRSCVKLSHASDCTEMTDCKARAFYGMLKALSISRRFYLRVYFIAKQLRKLCVFLQLNRENI